MRIYIALLIALLLLSVLGAVPARAAANFDDGPVYLPAIRQQAPADVGINPAIVGGQDADPNEWPWQVFIIIDDRYACGGAIIDAQWVLTAAHCVAIDGTYPILYYPPSQIIVRAAEHNIFATEGPEQILAVAEVAPHPDYNPYSSTNDLALLKLETPVALGATAAVIPLVTSPADDQLTNPDNMATATGWGSASQAGPHSLSDILQEVELPLISNAECQAAFGGGITDTMICAGYNGVVAKDTCYGDSGGPLVVPDAQGGWKLAGVTSFGPSVCATLYGGYTRVSKYTIWINSHFSQAEISSFSPMSGPVGSEVTITGSGFSHATNVSFGDVAARFTVLADNMITARVPAKAVTGPLTVVGPYNTTVTTQNFTMKYPVNLKVKGPGTGYILSNPGTNRCDTGDNCKENYDDGTTVTLTAIEDFNPSRLFAGWMGACSGISKTCSFDVTSSKIVTGVFSTLTPRLNLEIQTPDGALGNVKSTTPGLDCDETCMEKFDVNSIVTLEATHGTDSKFISWDGACIGSDQTCNVLMMGAQNVTALFKPDTYTVTVATSGEGVGRVTSFPADIDCGDVCSSTFETATSVNLSAQPATGSGLSGWSGDCTGVSLTCTVSIDRAMSVTAHFEKTDVFLPVFRAHSVTAH